MRNVSFKNKRELFPVHNRINFDQLWVTSNNEGTNSLVNERIGRERMVRRAWLHNECHKTHNGWYLEMVAPISSILGLLILYSKKVVALY